MTQFNSYLSAIGRIKKKTGIALKVKQEGKYIEIDGLHFYPSSTSSLLKSEELREAVLVKKLDSDTAAFCIKNGISFLTSNGDLFFANRRVRITLENSKPSKANNLKKPTQAWLGKSLAPTALISPNGFAILHELFQIPDEEIRKYKSAFRFVRQHGLNQSKLSHIMTGLNVKSLVDLKNAVRALPTIWWESAFHYPIAKRGLTPFFETARPFHMVSSRPGEAKELSRLPGMKNVSGSALVMGPMGVAKSLGFLRTTDVDFWTDKKTAHVLKKELRLVPGPSASGVTWYIATIEGSMKKEAIIANTPSGQSEQKPNIFRAIWDLSFGDERIKEIQMQALSRVIRENRS